MQAHKLTTVLKDIVSFLTAEKVEIVVEPPTSLMHGDYTTNVAMVLAKVLKQSPMQIAETIKTKLLEKKEIQDTFSQISVAVPGFLNFYLKQSVLMGSLGLEKSSETQPIPQKEQKKIMIEYAHPNTHKEMHIGHMRTLITGEALARLLEATGNTVFRANYQGDIGPHVAKAIFGIQRIMEQEDLSLDEIRTWSKKDKAHFLGRGYVAGTNAYEENQDKIDTINKELYQKRSENYSSGEAKNGVEKFSTSSNNMWSLYQETRQWSLDYYDEFYTRFYTKFDRLFFESEMAEPGKKIVEAHLGSVFTQDNGAVIFPGEKYKLHTRVFITQAGNPTYEGKEMGNAFAEHNAFAFDQKIHVVGSEQAGYFQVVFKALELIDPEKFLGKQHHVSMGMVQFADRKMSSRTGDILTVDFLLDQVKSRVDKLMEEGKVRTSASSSQTSPLFAKQKDPLLEGEGKDEENLIEEIVIGAVKYSVLKVSTGQDVAFDIEKSLSLDGDSGPYLQYTYARTRSVLGKWQMANGKIESLDHTPLAISHSLVPEELVLLRILHQFSDVVVKAADKLSPHLLCMYLFDLAKAFNLFYQKVPILKADAKEQQMFRLSLTEAVGKTMHQGLHLLGITAPERM
ncbi:MAG TPA: arginine--tRNA ligase [Patescibacteria group bacterium]|nr:arginine--tRNA ligase [Patescibacteria group bacterium]